MADNRWDPFAEMTTLRDAMDRLLRDSFLRVSSGVTSGADAFPIDVAETEDGYLVRAYLPGICPENAHLSTHGDTLTIRAELPDQDESGARNWLLRDYRGGMRERTIRLPTAVDAENAQAHCEHGVMRLELPKAASAKPRRIPVTSSNHSSLPESHETEPLEGEVHRDEVVADASDMSFPASDPPAWTPGRPGGGTED